MSIPQSGGGPIERFEQLAEYMASGNKPKSEWRIGTEHEKFGYLTNSHLPLPYDGPQSVRAVLEGLRDRFAWQPVLEQGHIIGLTRNGANVSCPVLVINISAVLACTPSHAQRVFEAVGHADKEYADVAGADHYYIERPELLPKAVELCSDWIARKFG